MITRRRFVETAAAGVVGLSAEILAAEQDAKPETPSLVGDDAGRGPTWLAVQWASVQDASNYELERRGGDAVVLSRSNVATQRLDGLIPNRRFELRVRAMVGSTWTDWSDPLVAFSRPPQPSRLSQDGVSLIQAAVASIVRWDYAPLVVGLDEASSIRVRIGRILAGGGEDTLIADTTIVGTLVINAVAGESYRTRLVGVAGTAENLSEWSDPLLPYFASFGALRTPGLYEGRATMIGAMVAYYG